ncbi:MAG: sulfatase-like hydrolase/transferase [Alphaproteobacteria bacterium]|nr:sulfatase-like hydrolase/transferase [Alphaproteobacteria bacterium]
MSFEALRNFTRPTGRAHLVHDGYRGVYAGAAALAWLPVGMLSVYAKLQYLSVGPASVLIISRVLGRESQFDVTWLEWLALFRADILLHFLVVPASFFLLFWFVRFRTPARAAMALACVLLLSVAATLVIFFNMLAYANIGRFLSLNLVVDAIRWGGKNDEAAGDYISARAAYKATAVGLASLAFMTAPLLFARWRGAEFLSRRLLPFSIAALGLVSGLCWAVGASAAIGSLPQHRSYAALIAHSMLDAQQDGGPLKSMSQSEVQRYFRETTGTPAPVADPRYQGKQRGSDVIYFIFETGPYRALPLEGDLEDFPALRGLMEHAFVGLKHHSTYPFTTAALLSLFTGVYPWETFRHSLRNHPHAVATGALRTLSDAGYKTAVYAPFLPELKLDDAMFEALGAQKQFFSNATPPSARAVERTKSLIAALPADRDVLTKKLDPSSRLGIFKDEKVVEEKLLRDFDALEAMKADIRRLKKDGQRFVTVFMPQLGHAPWRDIANHGDDYAARGRAIMAVQDAWLGEIVELLKSESWLDNTVIVVTADHGIRNRTEDPSFPQGMVDEYSFHVPLVVFAPRAAPSTVRLDHVTSHIDVTPTVLDLLGETKGRQMEQGLPIWETSAKHRTIYFMAGGILGADGFYRDGLYFMRSNVTGSVYRNKELRFLSSNLVRSDEPDYAMANQAIDALSLFTIRWSTMLIDPH